MIVHVLSGWLASSYPIRRAFLQHISWRVSVESVINKRKSSCQFAWRNGSIAVWIFVYPTEYGGDIGLKGFLISQKLFLSTSEYHHYYQGGKWNMPEFLKSPYDSLSKLYWFIWSCRFVFLVLNLIFPPSRFSLLSSGRSLCYLPHFAPTASRKKTSSQKYSLERNWRLRGESKLSKRWLAQLSENPVDCVCLRSRKIFSALFSRNNFFTRRGHFKELQVKGNLSFFQF